MIPQKQKLVAELFGRLAKPDLIAEGTRQAPHAADTPDDLNTDADSYFADDDTRIE